MATTIETKTLPAFVSIADWLHVSGMGRTSTYHALSRGDLRAHKIGSRTLIDVQHGLAWMRSQPLAAISIEGHAAQHAV